MHNETIVMLYSQDQVNQMILEAKESIDIMWQYFHLFIVYRVLTSAIWIMMMQAGFALFEAGSIRTKNTLNILLKCVVDIFIGVLAFFICGYGLTKGLRGGIIGTGPFSGRFVSRRQMLDFLINYSFCATSTTIVSGAMAERIYVDAYIAYSVLMTAFIYPIAAGWAWGDGWLQRMGYLDFSGSGVVHLVGGVAGLIGTIICGPRLGIMGKHLSSLKQSIKSNTLQESAAVQQHLRNSQLRKGSLHEYQAAIARVNYDNTSARVNNSESDNSPTLNIAEIELRRRSRVQSLVLFQDSSTLPMPERVRIFKSEFLEFSTYDNEQVAHLISMYDQNFDKKFQYHSMVLIVCGTYLLWVCWLFFNASAGKTISNNLPVRNVPQITIMNTMICGSTSSLIVFFLYPVFMRGEQISGSYNPINICNGLLSGLVGITASCNNVENYAAFVIGLVAGLIYIFGSKLLHKFQIDDPCSASQIHCFCGLWGVLAVGFFDRQNGALYTGNLRQLGVQALGAAIMSIWSAALTFPYFYLMMKARRLRVSPLYEIIGLDVLMYEEGNKVPHINKRTIEIYKTQQASESPQSRAVRFR